MRNMNEERKKYDFPDLEVACNVSMGYNAFNSGRYHTRLVKAHVQVKAHPQSPENLSLFPSII